MNNSVWSYVWEDGSRLELFETPDSYRLYEYDTDGNPVPYSVRDGYSLVSSLFTDYAKSDWTLDRAIADIESEYYI